MHVPQLLSIIDTLTEECPLVAFKKETEAEGASLTSLNELRALSRYVRKPLYVKIGGAEAISDIKTCQNIDVDGIIAPMIESDFAASKFVQAMGSVYPAESLPQLIINIESRISVQNLASILEVTQDHIHHITIGRSDLSASYQGQHYLPDDAALMDIVATICEQTPNHITITLGGQIKASTLGVIAQYPNIATRISQVETRNVVFDYAQVKAEHIEQALAFEKCLLEHEIYKLECEKLRMNNRLEKLNQRY